MFLPGKFVDISLNTRKQNQTGLLHSWRLHANDDDPKICPVRAFILLASLYGPEIKKSGPLFLHVTAQGAVMQSQPLVIYVPLHYMSTKPFVDGKCFEPGPF